MKILLTIVLCLLAVSAQAGVFIPVNFATTNGSVGAAGATGAKGETGTTGATGPAGVWSDSAYYGSYYDTQTDTNVSIVGINYVHMRQLVSQYGFTERCADSADQGCSIIVGYTGVYSLTFSAQLAKTDAGTDNCRVWLVVNGVAVPWSASQQGMTAASCKNVLTVNFVQTFNAGDNIQIAWHSDDIEFSFEAVPAGTNPARPAVPSIITTIVRVR
jgi:hypothetical protein